LGTGGGEEKRRRREGEEGLEARFGQKEKLRRPRWMPSLLVLSLSLVREG
jgi:hypothetical protein